MKLLVATTTCGKYIDTRAKAVKNSWFFNGIKNEIAVNHKFFTGNINYPDTDTIIKLDCEDSYEFLTKKTRKLFEYVIENFDFDYLLKTNDDTFLNLDAFLNLKFYNYDYGGSIFSLRGTIYSENDVLKFEKSKDIFVNNINFATLYYATGGGYFLKREMIKKCLDFDEKFTIKTFDNTGTEDVVIGSIVSKITDKILDFRDNSKQRLPYDFTQNNIFFHPIHYTLMEELYKFKNDPIKQYTILKYKSYLSDFLRKNYEK